MATLLPVFYDNAPGTLPAPPGGLEGDLGTGAEATEATRRRHDTDEKRPRKKRIITAARKEQNRQAQRLFRQRQKERRQQHTKHEGKPAAVQPELRPRPEPSLKPSEHCDELEMSSSSDGSSDPGFLPLDLGLTTSQLTGFFDQPGSNSLTTSTSSTRDSYSHSPSSGDLDSRSSVANIYDLSKPLVPFSKTLADPHANAIEFLPTTIFGAFMHNAQSLGFSLEDLASCGVHGISPFYRPSTPQDDPSYLVSSALLSLPHPPPEHLRPSLTQILIPHHPSLDLIPIPHLRDRAIALAAAMPQIYNLWELKLDIYTKGGLGMVKFKVGRNGKSEDCKPWDKSSWVAAPWFLQKWSMLIGDEQEQLTMREAQVEQIA